VRVAAESRAGGLAGSFQTHGRPSGLRVSSYTWHFTKINTGFLSRSGISHQAAMGWQEMAVIWLLHRLSRNRNGASDGPDSANV